MQIGLDERAAPGQDRPEDHAVAERQHAAEQDARIQPTQPGCPPVMIDYAMKAPIAPTAPNARLSTPVAR